MVSSNQLEAGKRWIEAKFMEIAQELGITVSGLEWRESVADFDHLQMSLLYVISESSHAETFDRKDIDHCPADRVVQGRLATQIKKALEPSSPRPKRIGF